MITRLFTALAITFSLAPSVHAGEPPTRADRLLKLAIAIDRLAPTPDRLDQSKWLNRASDPEYPSGCAAGVHAAQLFAADHYGLAPIGQDGIAPVYGEARGLAAVEAFFGLDHDEAKYLVLDGRAQTPEEVAAKLRWLATRGELRAERVALNWFRKDQAIPEPPMGPPAIGSGPYSAWWTWWEDAPPLEQRRQDLVSR